MKETTFYIQVSIKTANGFERVGKFVVGDNRKKAAAIFEKLKGNSNVDQKSILTLELVEARNKLPVNMQMITCTLQELGENCKIIMRDSFKLFNMTA